MLGLVLKLITDAPLNFHGLWDGTLWVQLCHTFYTDPSRALSTHAKAILLSLLYLQPEISSLPLSRRYCRIFIAKTQTFLQALNLFGAHKHYSAHNSSDYAKNVIRISHTSNLIKIRTPTST